MPGCPPVAVHLKVDTGMHRVGADPVDAPALAATIAADPRLALGAVWTHLAVADGADAGRPGVHRRSSSSGSTPSWPPWPRPATARR